jgi:hypothetical protein
MDISMEKDLLKKQIDDINDGTLLNAIKQFIGFTQNTNSRTLSHKDIVNRALESEKAIAQNRVTTLEDLEKELANW